MAAFGSAGPDASSWQRCSRQRAYTGGSDKASRDAGKVEPRELHHCAPAHTARTAPWLGWRRRLVLRLTNTLCPINGVRRDRLAAGT